jgi:hypothetical protein
MKLLWMKRILAIPAALFALVVGLTIGVEVNALASGLIGIPDTLPYDTWKARTAAHPTILDNAGNTCAIFQNAAAQLGNTASGGYVVYVGGQTTGPFANFASTTLGQFGMAGTSTTVALMAGNGSGVAQTPFQCTTGTCTVGASGQGATFLVGGGSAISALPGVITLPAIVGQGAGTGDFARGTFPNDSGTATIETCTFRSENAGTNAVSCQPILYDATAAANVCAVTSFNCNSAAGTVNTCTGGTIPANHVYDLRWTIAATGVSPAGSLVCSYHF